MLLVPLSPFFLTLALPKSRCFSVAVSNRWEQSAARTELDGRWQSGQEGTHKGIGLAAVRWYWWKSKARKITEGELTAAAGHGKVLDLFKSAWPRATPLIITCWERPPSPQGCVNSSHSPDWVFGKRPWNMDQAPVTNTDFCLNTFSYQLTTVSTESLRLDKNNVRYLLFKKLRLSGTFHSKSPPLPCQSWVSSSLKHKSYRSTQRYYSLHYL